MYTHDKMSDSELQKQKVRDKYRGSDTGPLDYTPGKKKADFYDDIPRRVAVYVRVSTDNIQQTSSYELQKNYYEKLVNDHENWTLAGIYADEGISGTSLQHRESFLRMIEDCRAGKIDLIITKSVSRFARNIVDCIRTIDELKNLKEPVGVFFETEHIFSLKDDSEMSLSFTATMAQEESHIKSNIMNASLEMRFSRGICLTPVLLGYDHDEYGKLVINEDEANTVRLIFFLYLCGHSCQEIADKLTRLSRTTKKGNAVWNSGSINEILRNERYCGEILTRKTYTPSYKDHKTKKNNGERSQYRWKGEHQAIISKDDFIAVQHLMNNAKYGNKGILPELKIINDGTLKGFISINPRWAGFKAEEYISLAEQVCGEESYDTDEQNIKVSVNSGDFDFRGFEIARSQFFSTSTRVSVTFSVENLKFSMACVKKLNKCEHIELLLHPLKKLLVVRSADSKERNSMKWVRHSEKGTLQSRSLSGTAFLSTLFDIFEWKKEHKYRVSGTRIQKDDVILVFDMSDAEMYVGRDTLNIESMEDSVETISSTSKSVIAYPDKWAHNFGTEYYVQTLMQPVSGADNYEKLDNGTDSMTFADMHDLNLTERSELIQGIQTLIKDMKTEVNINGELSAQLNCE